MAADVAQYIGASPITTAINSAQSMGNYLSTMAMNAIQRQYMPALMAAQTGQKQAQAFMQQQHGNLFDTQNQWTPYTDAAKIGLQNSQQNLNQNYLPQLDTAKANQAALTAQYIPQKANAYTQMANNMGMKNNIMGVNGIPTNIKEYNFGVTNSMGIDPTTSQQLFIRGATLPQIAKIYGYDPNNLPNPSPYATSASINQAQMQTRGAVGLNTISNFVVNKGTPYGFAQDATMKAQRDAYSSDPQRQQNAVNYYAAQQVLPEISFMRTRMQGGHGGATTLEEMLQTMRGNKHPDISKLPANIQARSTALATQILEQANNAEVNQTLSRNPTVANTTPVTANSSPSAITNNVRTNFNSKADFQKYYNTLNSAQKMQLKQKMGV